MSLLAVVKEVCAVVGVAQPTAVVTAIAVNRTMQEMFSLANEMAQRIAYDTRDWTMLRKTTTMIGDGVFIPLPPDPLAVWTGTSAFPIPADYKRMLLTANVWRSNSQMAPMTFIPDTDEWLNRRTRGITFGSYGEWTMMGGQMLIEPIMGVGTTAYYAYMDKNCINLTSGGVSDTFTADTDTFRLDERLLKLGMIWQWKANKGTSYAEDLGTFGTALDMAQGHDSPAPIIIGRRPMSANITTAYPWPVPT